MSSQSQHQKSIDKTYRRTGDWEFVEVCTDEGITGTNTKHCEGFKRMVVDALAGKIDLIVTKSVNKLISQKDAIKDKQSKQATIEAYLETLKAQDTLVERFESSLWCALLDFVAVYSKKMCGSPSRTERKWA